MRDYCKKRLAKISHDGWELNFIDYSVTPENKECPARGSKKDGSIKYQYTVVGRFANPTKFKPNNNQEYRVLCCYKYAMMG